MSEKMNKEELIELIKSLPLDKEDFIILSSTQLTLRGILDTAGDLDIAVTEKGLEKLKQKYDLKPKNNGWFIVSDKIECILDPMEEDKELVGGYYLQTLENYLSYIKNSTRQKDIERVSLIEQYMNRG